ncbi:DNA-binding protein [Francisellaceae bacterium]|nr:DNA-binding protein [Francisellaceae bacterium]
MARPGITYDDVATAAQSLLMKAEKITIVKLKEELGGHGSTTTISKHYKEWKEKAMASSAAEAGAPEEKTQPSFALEPAPAAKQPEDEKVIESKSEEKKVTEKPIEKNEAEAKKSQARPAITKPQTPPKAPLSRPKELDPEVKLLIENAKHLSQEMLATMSDEWDVILNEKDPDMKVKKLHAALIKEQSRRESAESMGRDAQLYADAIKEQIAHRVDELRDTLESQISFLNGQIRYLKKSAEEDLEFYRKQLTQANEKIISLAKDQKS